MSEIKINKIAYGGWENCVQIANDLVDLVVTTDVGPRIIRYGYLGRENELCEINETLGFTGGDEWRVYGGHRLWHSPEAKPRTYEPDNVSVRWEEITDGIKTFQDTERSAKIGKEIEIRLDPDGTEVQLLHRLTNAGPWPVELSVWSISAMAIGGRAVIPQTMKDTGLLPNRQLVLWPYTNLQDQRLHLGKNYIVLDQDPNIAEPLKIGISNENGWAAYHNGERLFIKYYEHHSDDIYPDFGASFESYTSDFMLELETLSPLRKIEPGSFIEHREKWKLFDKVHLSSADEKGIYSMLEGKVPEPR